MLSTGKRIPYILKTPSTPSGYVSFDFTSVVNLTLSGTDTEKSLVKNTGGAGWNSGAFSTVGITNNGSWIEWTTTGIYVMLGLSTTDGGVGYTTIQYCTYAQNTSALSTWESGVADAVITAFTIGDTLKMEYLGTEINLYVNGVLKYTWTSVPVGTYYIDLSIYQVGSSINNLKMYAI